MSKRRSSNSSFTSESHLGAHLIEHALHIQRQSHRFGRVALSQLDERGAEAPKRDFEAHSVAVSLHPQQHCP